MYGEPGGLAKQTATEVLFLRLLAPPHPPAHLLAPFGGRLLQEGVRGLGWGGGKAAVTRPQHPGTWSGLPVVKSWLT